MDSKLLIVARREYMERVRSRWFIAMTLLMPALLVGAVFLPMWATMRSAASTKVREIIVLDATSTRLGERVVDNLMADTAGRAAAAATGPILRTVTAEALPAAEAAALRQVMAPASAVGYLVLDDSTLAGASARYAGRNASSIADMQKLQTAVRQALMMVRLEREGMQPATITNLSRMNLRMTSERVDERGRGGSGQAGFMLGLVIGILLFVSIMVHGQAIMRGVLEEKTTRVAEVVISSVKAETLLAGKVLGVGAVGLTQQVLWLGISAYLWASLAPMLAKAAQAGGSFGGRGGMDAMSLSGALAGVNPGMIVVVMLFFLVGFVFYAALYAAAGAMVNSEQEAQQAMMPVMLLIMPTWLAVNPVLMNPTGTLAVVLSWLPFSSPIILPIRMGLVSVPWWTIAGSLVVGALGCVAVVWLSARIYRVGMLMYGKRPSFGELARWIRYA